MIVPPKPGFSPNPLLVLAATLSLGIVAGHFGIALKSGLPASLALGIVLTLLALWSVWQKRFALAGGLTVAAFFCLGVALALTDGRGAGPDRIQRLYNEGVIGSGDPAEVTGVLSAPPETAPESFYLTLNVEKLRLKNAEQDATGVVSLVAYVPDRQTSEEYGALELRYGARIRVMTSLDREVNFRNLGVSPFTEYLERKGYDATGVVKSPLLIERLDDERVFLPLAWLYHWRERLEKEFHAKFSPETAGVLDATLLGNRNNVSHATAERFRAGGTFHLLVIAGLHISFIGGLAFLCARWLTKRRILQFMVAAAVLWGYTIAVGARESVTRAALMFTLVALAPVVARRANSLNAIGGAAIALLVWRPGELFDPSFQLTFVSVLAIVCLAVPILQRMQRVGGWRPTRATPYPPSCSRWFRALSESMFWSERRWTEEMALSHISYRLFKTPAAARLERWRVQRVLRYMLGAFVISASVQIGLLPLLVIYFHRLSIGSLVLNIFVGLFIAALACVALGSLVVSHLSSWLAAPLITLVEKVNWAMVHLVDPFIRLGLASFRLPHYSGWLATSYVIYYLPLCFLILALARWNPLRATEIAEEQGKVFSVSSTRFAGVALVIVLAVIVAHPFSAPRPNGQLRADFLDVGQGDSALLTMPDGTTLLVDGGGRPKIVTRDKETDDASEEPFERDTRSIGEAVVSEYLWARGMDRVDYILATHADADHIDGLCDIASNFKVRGAMVARTPSDNPEYARFAETMKEAGVPVEKISAGDVLRFGNVSADVLWPVATTDARAPSRNNDSVMLRVRFGEKVLLFTGDIEKAGEAAVLKLKVDLHSDVVKVPHHGSRTSSTDVFVDATHPSLAVISVGRTSIFGHPNKEVVERWRASSAEVMTTGQRGTITVTTDGHSLRVHTYVE